MPKVKYEAFQKRGHELAIAIQAERIQRGLTLQDLSDRAARKGLGKTSLAHKLKHPDELTLGDIAALASALQRPYRYFIEKEI